VLELLFCPDWLFCKTLSAAGHALFVDEGSALPEATGSSFAALEGQAESKLTARGP